MTDQFLWFQLQRTAIAELEYTLLKPDYHSWSISKMQSGREDTLEEQCAIKILFLNLEKMPQKTYGIASDCFFDHLAWIEHQFFEWHKRFKEGRESVRDDQRYGRSKEVNTPELIGQKLRVRATMLRFLRELRKRFPS